MAFTPKRSVKAFICSYNLNWEGSSFSNFELICSLTKRGVLNPTIYCFQDGPLHEEYKKLGIPVIIKPSPISNGFNISAYMEGLENFKNLITLLIYPYSEILILLINYFHSYLFFFQIILFNFKFLN